MNLRLKNYAIKSDEHSDTFNLFKIRTFKAGKNIGKEVEIGIAYGISFERCVMRIITLSTDKLTTKSESTLQSWINQYKATSKEVLEELQSTIKNINLKQQN